MSGTERVELRGGDTSWVTPAQWQERVVELTTMLTEAGLSVEQVAADLRETFGGITFRSTDESAWRHDGSAWWRWTGSEWQRTLPPPRLRLDRVIFDVEPEDSEPVQHPA